MSDYMKERYQKRNFLSGEDLVRIIGQSNSVLDSASVLISKGVTVGKDNVFYPNVIIECQDEGSIVIGNGNIFYPGVYIISSAGSVRIGNGNEFGPAGVTIKSTMLDAIVQIGDSGRYCDGVSIMGKTALGTGSQILGNIIVQDCTLARGGTYQDAKPDQRAAVLKGFGLARDITLEVGQVINGAGDFSKSPVEWQRTYHPRILI